MAYEAIKKGQGKICKKGDECARKDNPNQWDLLDDHWHGSILNNENFNFRDFKFRRPLPEVKPEPQTVVVCGKKLIVGNVYLFQFLAGTKYYLEVTDDLKFADPHKTYFNIEHVEQVSGVNGEVLEDAEPTDLECEIDMINAYIEGEGLDSIDVEIAAMYALKRLEDLSK